MLTDVISFTECKRFCLALLPCRSVLTVACEQTEVLLFDPISSKHIKTLSEAHEDCVNNIRWVRRNRRHRILSYLRCFSYNGMIFLCYWLSWGFVNSLGCSLLCAIFLLFGIGGGERLERGRGGV